MAFTSGINHVVVVTENLDGMVSFYRDAFDATSVFDAKKTPDYPRFAIVEIGGSGQYIKVIESTTKTNSQPAHSRVIPSGVERFALAVDTLEKLRLCRHRILKAGFESSEIERLPTQWVLSVRDPDGFVVQVSAFAG